MDQPEGNAFNFQLNALLAGWIRIFFRQATVQLHEIVNWDDREGGGDNGLSLLYDFACLFFSSRFCSNALLFKYIVA